MLVRDAGGSALASSPGEATEGVCFKGFLEDVRWQGLAGNKCLPLQDLRTFSSPVQIFLDCPGKGRTVCECIHLFKGWGGVVVIRADRSGIIPGARAPGGAAAKVCLQGLLRRLQRECICDGSQRMCAHKGSRKTCACKGSWGSKGLKARISCRAGWRTGPRAWGKRSAARP